MYQKLCTEYYDLEKHKDHDNALAFYMQYGKEADGPILEPMCGTGRFLLPLLKAGFDIEGFDASSYMLAALKEKLAKFSTNASRVWQQYIHELNLTKRYKLIFVPYGSWGLITDLRQSIDCLNLIYKHLAEDGKFVFEIETESSAPKYNNIWHRGSITRSDGSFITINTKPSYNPQAQIYTAICHYESIRGNVIDSTETENFQMYLYKFNQMDELLHHANFKHIKKYQDFSRNTATDIQAPLIIYECSK